MKKQTSKIKDQKSIRGFSLIEVLIATVLVGFAIAALVAANGSFSLANVSGADLSTAEFLVEQIRELTAMLPVVDPAVTTWTTLGRESGETTLAAYDDVDDFDDLTFCPPIDPNRAVLQEFPEFAQKVTVVKIDCRNFSRVVPDNDPNEFVRITVDVLKNNRQISSANWVRARY
jgi:prepilin-type N-terminal cleavage/methylation domain-containing protein